MIKDYSEDYVRTGPEGQQQGGLIIQNAGTSSVGRAVIQLASHWGHKTISVIRDR
jgi:NADPH:quinone reductase-like Zn-dependent oxidoreductase